LSLLGSVVNDPHPNLSLPRAIELTKKDSTVVLGMRKDSMPDFIKRQYGKGYFLVHAAPICFTNYFMLSGNNKDYTAKALSYLPSKLPQGMTEFETWAKSIIDTYQMPDNESVRFALASAVLHLPATAAYTSKAYFGKILLKGASSQVSYQVMEDLKTKQKEQQEAEIKSKQPAEVTTDNQVGTITDVHHT